MAYLIKSDNRSLIAFSLLLMVCSSCGAAGPPFLYPHTGSPYLIQPKVAEKKHEAVSGQSPSISSGSTSEKKEITPPSSEPQRERVVIDAPFDRTWQAVLKFCVLNKYHIVKESKEDGTIECNIASNNAQYPITNLPEEVLRFVSIKEKIHGLIAWDITMAIFLSPSNSKTLVEFIPNYNAISTESSHAREELKSSGYFESLCVSFINDEVKSY